MYLLMTLGAALSFTVGGIFMQMSQGLSQVFPTLLVYLCFGMGASLQTLAMNKSGVMGITYVLVVGLEAVLAVLFGAWLFQENYSLFKLAGVGLIAMGIIFLKT
jgi:small multidrug resistance pump/quaternary ammonium compound-resistance protein SugE